MCKLKIRYLGQQEFLTVFTEMREFNAARNSTSADEFWCLQHPPVVTLGAHASNRHIRSELDIPVVHTDRGGQVTFHAPGQAIVYLLIDLRRKAMGIRQLVKRIEQAVIDLLGTYRVSAEARSDAHGVYIDGAKVASLGLRVSGGCCYHGVALNVDMDLAPFSLMDPCGFPGLDVTQLRDHGIRSDCQQVLEELTGQLCRQLDYKAEDVEVFGQ